VKVDDATVFQQAGSFLKSAAQHRVLSSTPENACEMFGKGFADFFWDAEKSDVRDWSGDCGADGLESLNSFTSQDKFKKVCSLTGPATAASCGEKGFLANLKKIAEPFMGLVTEECR
jgi:hypothetical protein